MKDCSVCEVTFDSNYCPTCGQKKYDGRISLKVLLGDFTNSLFQLDKSITANLLVSLKEPSKIINNYLNGYRNYYFSPAKFFILASLVLALNFLITETSFFIFSIKSSGGLDLQFSFLLIMLIFFSLTSFIGFYKWKKSFLEHIIINLFTISFWTIIFTPISILVTYLDNEWVSQGSFFLYLLMIFIWNSRVFKLSLGHRIFFIILNILIYTCLILGIVLFTGEFK